MSLDTVNVVSTTKPFCKPLRDDEIIYIIEYYPQTSFSLVSKKFDELRQRVVFFGCRRNLSLYRYKEMSIYLYSRKIEYLYSLSTRIGDDFYQKANKKMLCAMKTIFDKLGSSEVSREIITSAVNIENYIKIMEKLTPLQPLSPLRSIPDSQTNVPVPRGRGNKKRFHLTGVSALTPLTNFFLSYSCPPSTTTE